MQGLLTSHSTWVCLRGGCMCAGGLAGTEAECNSALPAGTVQSFGSQNYNRLTIDHYSAKLQCSDEYHISAKDYDLYILNAAGTAIVASFAKTRMGAACPSNLWKLSTTESGSFYGRAPLSSRPPESGGIRIGPRARRSPLIFPTNDTPSVIPFALRPGGSV